MSRVDRAFVVVDASVGDVFGAFRDHYIEWMPPTGMRGRLLAWDFRAGGRYAVELVYVDDSAGKSGGNRDVAHGVFEVVDVDRVVQTAEFDSDDDAYAGTMRITWSFTVDGAGTRVDVAASDVPRGISAADHEQGLAASLAQLKRFIER